MKTEIVTGSRRRTDTGWERTDHVLVNDRMLRGYIAVSGRRKHPDEVVTRFGNEERSGSDPWWLMARNGIVRENEL